MSYLILALLFSFLVGGVGYLLLVWLFLDDENAYHMVWGSSVFWLLLAATAYFTTGWSSFAASFTAGFLAFIVLNPDTVVSTWRRAIVRFANTAFIRRLTPINATLRFVAARLQNADVLFKWHPARR